MWSGEDKQGGEFITRLKQLGTPVVDRIAPMTYPDWLNLFESAAPCGRHYAVQTRWLGRFEFLKIRREFLKISRKTFLLSEGSFHYLAHFLHQLPVLPVSLPFLKSPTLHPKSTAFPHV
jgi:hypothetical protein